MNKILIIGILAISLISLSLLNYADKAGEAGIDHSYSQILGGGVSFCDFNGDGWDDMTLATGDGEKIQFYTNNQGSFQLLNTFLDHDDQAQQTLWVDFDNDGDQDIYIASYRESNRLFENKGDFEFVDISAEAGLDLNKGFSYGACWADYNRDGWLDLYYSDRKGPEEPENNECRLFMNNADGTFTETTQDAGVADLGKKPFCSAFLDYNNDGWPDIYTAHDKLTINSLFKNNGDGTFTNVSEETNTDLAMFAMCVAVGDYNNDGWQDLYISNTVGNKLLENKGPVGPNDQVIFEEKAAQLGVGFYGVGWGSNFLDAENDGDLDLYVSGSLIGENEISSQFYENPGTGGFLAIEDGFEGDTVASYNNAVGDYNNDGFPDIMVVNSAPHKSQLWSATGGENHWVKIELEGVLSNKDGIGSRIDIFTEDNRQMRYTHCGIGYLGQNSSTEIIGLGMHEVVDSIHISWTTGHIDRLYELSSNQKYHILEGSTTNGEIFIAPGVNINITSSDESIQAIKELVLYPNPASDYLHCNSMHSDFENYKIQNSGGQTLLAGVIESPITSIKVASLSPGIYFITFFTRGKGKYTQKFLKN